MKNHRKKTVCRSFVSIFIFMVFLFLGLGSNSFYEITGIPLFSNSDYESKTNTYNEFTQGLSGESLDTFYQHQILGPKDKYGNWEGEVRIYTQNNWISENGERRETTKFEKVQLENGKRNGQSITEYFSFIPSRANDTVCYDYGIRIPCSNLKSTLLNKEDNTGFNVLQQYYPWFISSLNVFGFTNEYVKSFMDTIEVLLNAESFDVTKLDSHYDDAIEILEKTQYDSLIQLNSMVTSSYGKEQLKDLEFRMAVIDQQREKDKGTFYFLQNGYPHFLTSFNSETTIVQDSEWEAFCSKFDSLMNTFLPLDNNDPFFVDSVDSRIFSTLMSIAQEEPDTTKSAIIKSVFKQVGTNMQNLSLSSLLKEHETILLQQQTESIKPQAFATAILIRMARKYLFEGDVPRLAVKEAYANQQSVLQLAIVTTHLNGKISENNFELLGNVIKDGGAEITERGMVWAKYNNPTVDDNKILAGEGIGGFTATLQINDNDNYYIKAFATNSVGTAYGNGLIINNSSLVGLDNVDAANTGFTVYPNPASNEIHLDFEIHKPEKISIEIIDLNGRIVLQAQIKKAQIGKNHININISGLKNGMYICNVKGERTQPFAQKIYKTH